MNVIRVMQTLFWGISIIGLSACDGGSTYVPISSAKQESSQTHNMHDKDEALDNSKNSPIDYSFTIAFEETQSGVKTVHLKFNDTASFNAIFDTGCSGLLISMQEALSLVKAGTLSLSDRIGTQQSSIANGEIMENEVFNIHTVTITDVNGKAHTLNDIPATVANNPGAPVLVGNIVIDQLAKKSYTIDLSRRVIVFNP